MATPVEPPVHPSFPFHVMHFHRLFDLEWMGLNLTRWSPTGDYNISLGVDLLHRLPKLDMRFQPIPTNGTSPAFDPSDKRYLESLGLMVAAPALWLIITLLFFLIFFLCRCCDSNSKKGSSLGCCKCCLLLLTTVCMAVITVGIIGNIRAHDGMTQVHNHTQAIISLVDTLRNETNNVESTMETKMDEDLNKVSRKLIGPLVRNYTVLSLLQEQLLHMRRNVTKGINRIGEMNSKIERIDLSFIPRTIDQFEQIRWPATFAVLGGLLFFCFLLMMGTCRHSRCLLIVFSVLGLLTIVICYVLTAVYIGTAIGGGDFCFGPKPFIQKHLSNHVEESIVSYYLECDVRSGFAARYATQGNNNPFKKQLRDIRKSLDGFEHGLYRTSETCETYCPDTEVKRTLKDLKDSAKKTQDTISFLMQISECEQVHMDFLWTMSALCRESLEGVLLMMASAAASGAMFTFLVLCASHTWINIRKKRPQESNATEEMDPFLPPAGSATSTVTSTSSTKRQMQMMSPAVRDTYLTASGTGGRPRFSHTPPQTPHMPGFTVPPSQMNQQMQLQQVNASRTLGHQHGMVGTGGHEQLSFVAPPPAYEQVHQHQNTLPHQHQQQQQQQQQQQHHHANGNLYGHHQQQGQHTHQQQMTTHQPNHHHSHHQVHYIGDPDMMRATQATKF